VSASAVSTLVITPPTLFVPFLCYLISLITIRSPLGIATTRTLTGLCVLMSLLQTLLDFIISTTLVLLASSKWTILPSGVSRPKEVVVVVAGHSVTTFVVRWSDWRSGRYSFFLLGTGGITALVDQCAAKFTVVVVVVLLVSVWSVCALRQPTKIDRTATAANLIFPPNVV